MNKFILKTKYDCLIKNKDEEILFSPCETLTFDENDELLVYPLGKPRDFLPFIVSGKTLANCPYYNFASFEGDTLVCLSNYKNCENYSISKLKMQGQEIEFQVSENKLVVTSKDWRKIITLDQEFEKFSTGYKNDIAYIKLSSIDSDTLYAFNIKSAGVRQFKGREIIVKNDGFDIKNNGVESFTIDAQGLKAQNEEEPENDFSLKPEKVGFLFLQEIKNKKYQNAYAFCSQSLKEKITKDTLKNFFVDMLDFYYISPTTYALQTNKNLKICKFTLYGSQIDDIDI